MRALIGIRRAIVWCRHSELRKGCSPRVRHERLRPAPEHHPVERCGLTAELLHGRKARMMRPGRKQLRAGPRRTRPRLMSRRGCWDLGSQSALTAAAARGQSHVRPRELPQGHRRCSHHFDVRSHELNRAALLVEEPMALWNEPGRARTAPDRHCCEFSREKLPCRLFWGPGVLRGPPEGGERASEGGPKGARAERGAPPS